MALNIGRRATLNKALLTAVSALVLTAALACSPSTPRASAPATNRTGAATSHPASPSKSLEQLEQDKSFLAELDPNLRALEFSRLWFEHATRLERVSYVGAFAAFSRSAHTALHELLSDTCRTPFHSPCHDLDQSYKRALDALAKLLQRHSWEPPNLEPTRYRLTPESLQALRSLPDWRISFEQPSYEHIPTRPGLGLAAVGCRHMRAQDTTCSPLTFVATFSGNVYDEKIEISFRAFDAYQQEVLTIGSTNVPIAAAFEQTALALGTLAANAPKEALYCFSVPTAATNTSVIILEPSEALASARSILVPLLRDPAITATNNFCIKTVGASASPAGAARSAVESLRAAHTSPGSHTLATTARLPLTILSIGDHSADVAVALANRTSRARPPQLRKPSREPRFMPQGLVVIRSGNAPAPTTDIPSRSYEAPCSLECVSGIKDLLSSSFAPLPMSDLTHGEIQPENDELSLSPVI